MERYVALLGGINVGGHRVKMEHLRRIFEELGFNDVSTFIASGNVLFHSQPQDRQLLERQIELQVTKALGYTVPIFIRTFQELLGIVRYQPFLKEEASRETDTLSILFLAHPVLPDIQTQFLTFRTPIDEFHFHHQEIYWLCRGRLTESQVDWPRMSKTLVLPPTTMRNITTIRKLVAKYAVTE